MNAFQIYEAAFDSAQSEFSQDTLEYIIQYADGALNVALSDDEAKTILDCRLAWVAAADAEGGIGSTDTFWHTVEKPLREIEIQ